MEAGAAASHRSKTLFTKSSPRRVQRAAALIVAFVVNGTVEDHSAADRPTPETRSPLLCSPFSPVFAGIPFYPKLPCYRFQQQTPSPFLSFCILNSNPTLLVLKTLFSDTPNFFQIDHRRLSCTTFIHFFAITCPDLLQLTVLYQDLFNLKHEIISPDTFIIK